MLVLFHRGISHTDIFCLLIFPSITNCIMHFKMYADEMQQVIEIEFFPLLLLLYICIHIYNAKSFE